jgi:DNA polymerase-3 subunit gamma/tau
MARKKKEPQTEEVAATADDTFALLSGAEAAPDSSPSDFAESAAGTQGGESFHEENAQTDSAAGDFFGEAPQPESPEKPQRGGYVVLARRYRPQTFDDIVGQEHVREALRRAILEGQVAHAYLFSGPRGTGKTSTARILAKALNCQTNGPRPDPCGKCASCRAIMAGSSLDVIEIDAASNTGVDNIRDLRTGIVLAPFSRYKVYIVDEVHMLSMQAFNALLKTLEEPPPRVIFVLATTELHKVPQTIISRCQCFQFRRFTTQEIVDHLDKILTKEAADRGIEVDAGEKRRILELIAQSAEGGMRDAQVALDQILVLCRERLDYETVRRFLGGVQSSVLERFVRGILARQTADLLLMIDEIVANGLDLERFIKSAAEYLRNILLVKQVGRNTDLLDAPEDRIGTMEELASGFSLSRLVNLCHSFIKLADAARTSGNVRFMLELEIVRLTSLDPEDDLAKLIEELRRVEQTGGLAREAREGAGGQRQSSLPARSEAPAPAPAVQSRASQAATAVPPRQAGAVQADQRDLRPPGSVHDEEPQRASVLPELESRVEPAAEAPLRADVHDGALAGELVERIVAAASAENRALSRALPRVREWRLAGGQLVLSVDPADRFTCDALHREAARKALGDVLRMQFGIDAELRVEFAAAPPRPDPPSSAGREEGLANSALASGGGRESVQPPVVGDFIADDDGASEDPAESEPAEEEKAKPPQGDIVADEEFSVEQSLERFRPPLKGAGLKKYLQDNPDVASVVDEFKRVFGATEDAVSLKLQQTEE